MVTMRPHCLLAILALLLPLVAAGPRLGGWQPIENVSEPEVKEMAEFAVSEYNKQTQKQLVFQSVVRAESQVVAGINYRLLITVKDHSNSAANYEAVVFHQSWTHVRQLVSFQKPKH